MRSAPVVSLSLALASCGLYAGGAGDGVSGDGGASPADGGAPVDATGQGEAAPPAPCAPKGSACVDALGAGWTPIAYASTRGAKCPQNYTEQDLVGDAVAGAGACTCACAPSQADPPSCSVGQAASMIGQSQCNQTGITYTFNGSGCNAFGPATVASVGQMTPLPPHVGACTSSTKSDTSKLTARDVRACVPPSACLEDVCQGVSPVGFAACVAHDGDVMCPGAPYVNRTVVGTQATLACGGCAGCANTVTCSNASIHFFVDVLCVVELASRKIDGNCNPLASGVVGTVTGYKYDVSMNAQCAAQAPATSGVALAGQRTVCCR